MSVATLTLATLTALTTQNGGQEAPVHYTPDMQRSIAATQPVAVVEMEPIAPTSAPETFAPETLMEKQFATSVAHARRQDAEAAIVPRAESHPSQHASTLFLATAKSLPEATAASSPETLLSPATTLATTTLAQTTRIPVSGSAGVSRQRTQTRRFTTVRVTNRTSRSVEIELVGTTRPITLLPGQTRQLRVKSRDLSLLYWAPSSPGVSATQLQAQVSQSGSQSLSVNLFRSEFPNDNLAIYFPEPDNPSQDILKVF